MNEIDAIAQPPLATIVIPTRNRRQQIELCLNCLGQQTFTRFETIVVNDGSNDDTAEFLDHRAMSTADTMLTVIHHDRPRGANASRNAAIAQAHTDMIAFLDDDCLPEPDWLARLLAGFDCDQVAAVTGDVVNVPPRNLWELFFVGQQRVVGKLCDGKLRAVRMVAGNMAVRRCYLDGALDTDRAVVSDDMTTSARSDEEGLFQRLVRAGHHVRLEPEARVWHDHPYTLRSFCKQAFNSGRSTARLVRKFSLPPRWELLSLALASVLTLCVLGILAGSDDSSSWLTRVLASSALFCFAVFFAAVLANERLRKAKTFRQILLSFPALCLYFSLRTLGYVAETLVRSELR